MRTLLKILLLLLLLIILIVGGVAAWATATESGTAQVLKLAQKYAPGELQWDSANGKLTGPLDLQNLSYTQPDGLELKLGNALLEWQPGSLISRKLKIDRLQIVDLELHLPPPAEEKPEPEIDEPISLPDINLPVDLAIDILFLKNIRIFPHGVETPIVIEEIKLAALGSDEAFQVVSLDFSMPDASARLSGQLSPRGNYPLDLKLDWDYKHAEFGNFSGNGTATGDLDKLVTVQQVKGAANLDLNATLTNVLNAPAWDATAKLDSSDIGQFAAALENTPLSVNLNSAGNLDEFTANGKIDTTLEQTGPVNLDLDVIGNTKAITINSALLKLLERPGQIALKGNANLETLELDLTGDWKSLGWPLTGAEAEYLLPKGTLAFKGTPETFKANINTAIDGKLTGPLDARIEANRKADTLNLSQLKLLQPGGDLALDLTGNFNLESQRFNAKGQWDRLQWPIVSPEAVIVQSDKGMFNAEGEIANYTFQLSTDARGPQIPAGNWTVSGKGSDKGLSDFAVNGKTLEGVLKATGTATWAPTTNWNIQLSGDGINPGVQWPEMPAKLNLKLISFGNITENGINLNADIARLDGKFRNMPVKGSGKIHMQGEALQIDDLNISSGSTRLLAKGKLAEQWDLKWDLKAPKLSQLVPELAGSIISTGKLSGSKEHPKADFKLNVSKLDYAGTIIETLQGSGSVDVSGNQPSKIKLAGKKLILGGQNWSSLALDGNGKPEKHNLNIALNGKLAKLKLKLDGGLSDQTWRGKLSQLSAAKTEFGDWKLKSPTAITANAETARADKLCLESKPTLVCLQGGWSAAKGSSGTLTLKGLKPERFHRYLPVGMKLKTALSGKANGSVDANGKITAKADFDIAPGEIQLSGDEKTLVINIEKSTISSRINNKSVDNLISLNLGNMGNIKTDLKIIDFDTAPKIQGTIKGKITDLSIISSLAPQVQAVEGALDADLKLSGTFDKPGIIGSLKLEKFGAEIPQINLRLQKTNLSMSSDGSGPLKIDGQAFSGKGKIKLSGDVDPASRALNLHLQGQDFSVANTKDIKADITPDMKIKMDSTGMSVDGILVVPKAYIKAGGQGGEESLASVSNDIIIIDENGEAKPQSKTGNMNINLRVVLGDDIKVEAGDFKGGLAGTLLIEQTPQLAPRGTGAIEVVNGDYVIYGQQLNMQRGKILFSGGPIDNPRLDMDVAREVPAYEVTAGAKIRGTAQAPILELYSDPAMPDASVLSYILLGQPPGTKGGSYTLGKYLTPDLYVSYGIGLFNAINTFNLRYKLTDKLSLQAKSGLASSADLIYTFER